MMVRVYRVQSKNENHALRSLTVIMMLFVVAAHYYSKFNINGIIVNDVIFNLGRFVIPIFALISGYFCFSKDGHAENGIMRKALHIFALIVIYKLLYLTLSSVFYVAGEIKLDSLITEFFIVSDTFKMDCYNGVVELRSTQTVWFIYSLFLVYMFWFFLYRFKINFKWAWLLVVPILTILLLFGEFLPMFHVDVFFDMEVVGLAGNLYPFVTFVFFVVGYFLHKHKEFINTKFSDGIVIAFIIVGVVMMCIECYFVQKSTTLYVGSVIVAVFLFLGTFRISKDKFRSNILEYMGRQLVAWMYISFSAANFLARYFMQSYASSYIICEVIGPFFAIVLDLIMALAFHLFLKYTDSKKAVIDNTQ